MTTGEPEDAELVEGDEEEEDAEFDDENEIDFDDERGDDQDPLDVAEAEEVGALLDDPEELDPDE